MNGLTPAQLESFDRDGYLIVENVLDDTTLNALRREYVGRLDAVAQRLHADGKLPSTYSELAFDERYTGMLQTCPEIYEHLDITLPMNPNMGPEAGVHTGQAVFGLLTHPRLLDIAESVIGPEIDSNPTQHVRIKPPESLLPESSRVDANVARTLWHQDEAVLLQEAAGVDVLTAWVAITEANRENGCMVCVAGSHKGDPLVLHCPSRTLVGEIYIPDGLIDPDQVVPLEVGAGAVVLLHRRTVHGAARNTSDKLRWSFDLRYQPAGLPSGRDCFPSFRARSRAHPESELRDPQQYAANWRRARERIVAGEVRARFNVQWDDNANVPLCA
jgi:ectoine hydroxylase-related dioxygenase (phytanoyl-CoA dioxygenase family)